MTDEEEALIDAYWFDGEGRATPMAWQDLEGVMGGQAGRPGFPWIHLQRMAPDARAFLYERSGLPRLACAALLADESRPRATEFEGGLVVDLRGVNMNPGQNPDDMVSLRMWCDGRCVVTVRRRKLMAIDDLREAIRRNRAPQTPAELMIMLADGLSTRMGGAISDLEDRVDDLEDRVVSVQSHELRFSLNMIRRQAIGLRRFIGPNREAVQRLVSDPVDWIGESDRLQLREVADRVTRYVEELDALRDRAAVVQDELSSRLAERLNNNTYVLSVIAAIFLPLSLLTGLLGINVGGIPGEKWSLSFWIVTVGIVVIGIAEYMLLKRLRWI